MALKDVIKAIPLYQIQIGTTSTYVIKFDLAETATALGMNYDLDTGVMYLGDNPNNGFLFTVTTNTLDIYLYVNGVKNGNHTIRCVCTSEKAYLYYVKEKDVVSFGITSTGSGIFKFMAGNSTSLLDGTKKYGYVSVAINNNYAGVAMEDGFNEVIFNGYAFQITDYFVQMTPLCTSEGFMFDNIFMVTMCKSTTDYTLFTMNNKNYFSISTYNAKGCKVAMEI